MEANDTIAVHAKRFRKAVKMIRLLVDHIRKEKSLPEKLAREAFDQVDDLAKEALIATPRNCDVGTVEEQIARFDEECLAIRKRNTVEPCGGCLCSSNGEGTEDCQLRWAQMPYESGTQEKGARK